MLKNLTIDEAEQKYQDYLATAKKYIKKLSPKSKSLIRLLAKCPNYNGVNMRLDLERRPRIKCLCDLDLMVTIDEIKTKANENIKNTKRN